MVRIRASEDGFLPWPVRTWDQRSGMIMNLKLNQCRFLK